MDSNCMQKPPLVIKKKISVLKKDCFSNDTALLRSMRVTRPLIIKEDIIYQSQSGDFMKGEYPNLIILNKLNILANSSRTTAQYTNGLIGNIERTSDDITKLIGQKNYDTVFSALCSVISQELRIQGILSLLTVQKNTKSISCQTGLINPGNKVSSEQVTFINTSCQTDETCSDLLQRLKSRKKIRRPHLAPYVVKDLKPPRKIKRVVIKPHQFEITKKLIQNREQLLKTKNDQQNVSKTLDLEQKFREQEILLNDNNKLTEHSLQLEKTNVERAVAVDKIADDSLHKHNINNVMESNERVFPELKLIVDEDSNISDTSCGNISITSCSIPNLLENPNVIFNNVDKHTLEPLVLESTTLTMLDGSQVKICGKPEDQFHIATAEILKYLNSEEQCKVMWYQAYIDWKFCLQRDEDYNLPIHMAVLNNDVDLLRRQCVVLKSRHESIDVTANGNLTALQMSIFQDPSCTAVLLQHGANPLVCDDEQRTSVHLAAEVSSDHLKAVVSYCQKNARLILHDNELWKPELETKSDEEISKYLLSTICRLYDNQGYTPLMLACKLGNYTNVKVLLDADPGTVNLPMPNNGNSPLYVAVAAACVDAENRGNKSKIPDHFLKTVEILLKFGADPSMDNNSGNNVNLLLNEFNIAELSLLIANTIISLKYSDNETNLKKDFSAFMLIKDEDGNVNVKEVKSERVQEKPQETLKSVPKAIEIPSVTNLMSKPNSSVISNTPESKSSPSEFLIYAKHVIKQEQPSSTKIDLSKIKTAQNIKIVPAKIGVGVKKIISVNQQGVENSKTPSNTIITTTPKIVKVSKFDVRNIVSKNLATAKVTSTVTQICNTRLTTTKSYASKRASVESRDQTRDVPIKKQKREHVD